MELPNKEDTDVQNVLENVITNVEEEEDVHNAVENILENINVEDKLINYQEQVLEYLKNQEEYPGEDLNLTDIMSEDHGEKVNDTAKVIVKQLLSDVNNITSFKEAYDKKKVLNNQYELFDLSTKVKDFYISDRVMELMAFRETLLISRVNDKGQIDPVGGLCLDVQCALGSKWEKPKKFPDFSKALLDACADIKKKHLKDATEQVRKDLEEYTKYLEEEMKKEYKKFIIHLTSEFNVDGKNAGSRITSWVDRNLHTLEENRTEFIDATDKGDPKPVIKKRVYIYMGKKHYDVRIDPGADYCQKYCYSFRRAQDFVGEAANFLLMRYLALVKFIGTFELASIHIEGALCRNIYQCDGPMGGFINNERMDLYKVYRTIVEECGIMHRSCTVLALDGRIMKHDWEKCDYVLQINPLVSPTRKKPTLILHLTEAWKYDLQLLSRYLDKKGAATHHMKSYLHDHREIGNLINDFIQNILQIKPDNIIEFTKHFFLSYAPFLITKSDYFEKDVNGCFDNPDE